MYHRGDTDTFIRFEDNSIKLTADSKTLITTHIDSGQNKVRIGAFDQDTDFQVTGQGDVNTLYVQGSSDRVGMGTDSPVSLLHLKESAPTLSIQRENNSNDSTIAFLGQAGATGAIMHLSSSNDLVFKTFDGSSTQEIMRLGGHQASDIRQVILLSGSEVGAGAMQPKDTSDINFFVSGAIGSKDTETRGTSVFGGDVVVSGSLTAGRQTMVQRLFWAGGIANDDYRFPSGPEGVTTTTSHVIQHMWTVMGSGSLKALDLWVNESSTARATVGLFVNESSVSANTMHVTGSFVNHNLFGTGNRGHLFIDFQDPANANFITGSNSFNPGDLITIGLCKTAGGTFTNVMGTLYYEVDTTAPHSNLPGGVPG